MPKKNLKGISIDGQPIDPEEFDSRDEPDPEIEQLRKEDSYKPLYKTIKEKMNDKKRKEHGKVTQYTKEEIEFINDRKPINPDNEIYKVISLLKKVDGLTKDEILSYPDISGKNFFQTIHKIYTGLSLKGYMGGEKSKNPNATNKKNSKIFSYFLTESGRRFSPEVLTKMAYYYFNQFKNERRKQLKDERKNQNLENNFEPSSENHEEENQHQEKQDESSSPDITININININITFS